LPSRGWKEGGKSREERNESHEKTSGVSPVERRFGNLRSSSARPTVKQRACEGRGEGYTWQERARGEMQKIGGRGLVRNPRSGEKKPDAFQRGQRFRHIHGGRGERIVLKEGSDFTRFPLRRERRHLWDARVPFYSWEGKRKGWEAGKG